MADTAGTDRGSTITAELPAARPLVYFLNLTDERKATVSTEHETLEKQEPAMIRTASH